MLTMTKQETKPSLEDLEEIRPKNHYFDNKKVEALLKRYVERGCTDIKLRDEIMGHASELIRQLIRAHCFLYISSSRDIATVDELNAIAWAQIERVLYKYNPKPGSPKVFNMFCINDNSLIFSEDGIKTIKEVISDKNTNTYGLNGISNIKNNISKDVVDTNIVITELGYNIECTPEHYLYKLNKNGIEWVQSKDLQIGDFVGVQYNQNTFIGDNSLNITYESDGDWNPPNEINEELAYLIGLYISEGSYTGNILSIVNTDSEVISFLQNNKLGLKCYYKPKYNKTNINNKRLIEMIKKLGLENKHAYDKFIPQKLLKCSKNIIVSMLRGMFDGDGHSSKFNGIVGYTSTSLKLINQLKVILLNFGIISKLSVDKRECRDFNINNRQYHSKLKRAYQITLSSHDSLKFYNLIGFNILRKQLKCANLKNIRVLRYGLFDKLDVLCKRYNISNRFSGLRSARKSVSGIHEIIKIGEKLSNLNIPASDKDFQFIISRLNEFMNNHNNIIWLPINKITKSQSKVCEIEVDCEYSSYIANGFITHNSQVAKTRILAHLKKEKRDKKNVGNYKNYLGRRYKTRSDANVQLWIQDARKIFEANDDFLDIINAIEKLWCEDEKPYDGLISKIERISKKNRNTINLFFKAVRLRRDEFINDCLYVKTGKEYDFDDNESYFYTDEDG
jgi:hypothetical protein